MLAVDDDERVMCLRQYRHTSGHDFVELPAGLRDAGDEPAVETARRELREEVELEASSWRLLLSTFPSAGISDEVHEIFLARGLTHAPRGDFEMRARGGRDGGASGCRWPTCSTPSSTGGCAQGPLALAVLAYDVLKRRGDPRRGVSAAPGVVSARCEGRHTVVGPRSVRSEA